MRRRSRKSNPLRRTGGCFLLFCLLWGSVDTWAQSSRRPVAPEARFDELEKEEAKEFLGRFRENTLGATYIFDFRLQVMPARGRGHEVEGRLWHGPVAEDQVGALVEIFQDDSIYPKKMYLFQQHRDGESQAWRYRHGEENLREYSEEELEEKTGEVRESHLLLLRMEEHPISYVVEPRSEVEELRGEALVEPILGTDYSAFDLQMPFLFWPETEYEGRYLLRGRSTYTFLAHPPESFSEDENWPWRTVRLHFDAEFEALMQVDWLDRRERARRTLALLEIKEVEDQWIPRMLDFRNTETRGKTRMFIERAAFPGFLAPGLFAPESLGRGRPVPDGSIFHPVK